MFVNFLFLFSLTPVECEDALIVSLAPDRSDNGHLVFFKTTSLTHSSKDDPVPLAFSNATNIKELLYDPLERTLYMTDILSNLFRTENISHSIKPDELTSNGIDTFSSSSSKIAIDWVSKNIYYIDPSFRWIIVQPLYAVGRSGRKTLIEGLISPKAIAVDPLNGYLFWSAGHSGRFAIFRSSLSGRDQTLLVHSLLLVSDITISDVEKRVYWLDIGRETLETCTYDGTDRRVLKRSDSLLMLMSGLTLHKDLICVAIQAAYLVECIDKETGQTKWQHLFQWLIDGKYEYKTPKTLKFISAMTLENKTQQCEEQYCEYLCIITRESIAKCYCPDGFILDVNGRNCTRNNVLPQKSLLLSNTSSICFVDVLSLTGMPITLNCILHWERSISNVAVDSRQDKIYFEDIDNKKLMILDVQSGQTTEFFSISGVSGICVDWLTSDVYWAEKTSGLIIFINERFPMEMPLFQNVDNPSSLTINPHNRTLYWLSGGVGTYKIEAGSSDGTKRWVVVDSRHLKYPTQLLYTTTDNRLSWSDVDGVYSLDMETSEMQSFPSSNIKSFTKYKGFIMILKNNNEALVIDTESNSLHQHLDSPGFGNVIVYDRSEQPAIKDLCRVRNGDCEHICIPKAEGTRTCQCRLGFKLKSDKKACISSPLKHDFVLTVDFTHAAIFQVSMTDAEVVAIDVNETMHPVNAIFHPLRRNLIYSDAMYREIRQLSLSGRSSVSLTNTGSFEPQALVVDPTTGHLIYSAVSSKSYIGILNMETKERKTVVPGLTSVYNIAIYPKKGFLFWSDLVYSASYIGRSYMDGSAMSNLIFKDILQPNSLTLDYKNELLYWTDGELRTVNYCDLNGENRGVLLKDNTKKFMLFDISGDYFYFTALDDQKITKASISNASEIAWMNYTANFGKLHSLQVYGVKDIPVNDVCSKANGGCSTFCLPTANSRKCACPDGVKLLSDRKTCDGVIKCPEDIPNGRLNPDCAPYFGNKCTFTCNPGYTTQTAEVLCRGTWNVSSLCVAVVTERAMTDPTNDGAIAGGIVAASLAVTLVLVLIIIFLCRRASDSPTPDSGTIHYGANSNGNSNGARKASRVIIEEAPSNNT